MLLVHMCTYSHTHTAYRKVLAVVDANHELENLMISKTVTTVTRNIKIKKEQHR